jgi:hypothetical protein
MPVLQDLWEKFCLVVPDLAMRYLEVYATEEGMVDAIPSVEGSLQVVFWAVSYGLIDADPWREVWANLGGDIPPAWFTLDAAALLAQDRAVEWDGSPRQR